MALLSNLASCRAIPARLSRAFSSSRVAVALNPTIRTVWDSSGVQQQQQQKQRSISLADAPVQDPVFRYCEELSTPLPEKFRTLHQRSIEAYPMSANKTISELQGQFLQLLMRITRPRSVLELGCFMGYSAMAMADGMSRGTTLYTCEKDAKAARLARDLFVERGYLHPHHPRDVSGGNGVQHGVQIQLLEGDALSSLESLTQQRLQFDAVFLDADKGNYINYLNRILDGDLLSENGYIIADNVLFRGMVLPQRSDSEGDEAEVPSPAPSPPLSPQQDDPKADAERVRSRTSLQRTADHMDAFNRHVKGDPRLEVVVLPIFDGISVIVRRNKA